MDPYAFTLVLGAAGLVMMAVVGAAHLGGPSGGHAGGYPGGGTAGAAHVDIGHGAGAVHPSADPHAVAATHAAGHSVTHPGTDATWLRGVVTGFVSPRALFTLLLGFGVTGVLARGSVQGMLLPALALAGALVLELGVMRPLWNFLFRFASAPALTLESSLLGEARAATSFNRDGEGLVAVEVDGQIVQCLGRLGVDDRALGVRVSTGDRLRVDEVDARRQRCTVSYVGRATDAG